MLGVQSCLELFYFSLLYGQKPPRLYHRTMTISHSTKNILTVISIYKPHIAGAVALLPVFDILNHRNPPQNLSRGEMKKPSFYIQSEPGFYTFSSDLPYKKNEEYAYTYTSNFFNAHLVEGYGFALQDNYGDFVNLQIKNPMLSMNNQ